jgi:hypothetical protein
MTIRGNMRRLDDWVAETPESITARLDGAKASQAQTRLTIGTMAVISVMMLIAAYNAYLSYDYGWILSLTPKDFANSNTSASAILDTQALKDWAAARTVQISFFGIRASVDDAAVLGSAVLLVLSLWLLLLARRENHTIGFLLRDTDTPRPSGMRSTDSKTDVHSGGERWLIFHTILANSLFVTCDPSLTSVQSLEGPNPLKAAPENGVRGWLNKVGFGFLRGFFFLFPAVTCFIVFCLDRWSYFIADPFAPNFAVPEINAFFWRSMVVFFVCWIPLVICCWRSSRYSKATEAVVREYGQKLRADLMWYQQTHDAPASPSPAPIAQSA